MKTNQDIMVAIAEEKIKIAKMTGSYNFTVLFRFCRGTSGDWQTCQDKRLNKKRHTTVYDTICSVYRASPATTKRKLLFDAINKINMLGNLMGHLYEYFMKSDLPIVSNGVSKLVFEHLIKWYNVLSKNEMHDFGKDFFTECLEQLAKAQTECQQLGLIPETVSPKDRATWIEIKECIENQLPRACRYEKCSRVFSYRNSCRAAANIKDVLQDHEEICEHNKNRKICEHNKKHKKRKKCRPKSEKGYNL